MTVVAPHSAAMNISNPAVSPQLEKINPFPTYAGPGYVEIKPHSVEQIKAGLNQLNDERKKRIANSKPGVPYLLTYTLTARPTAGGSTFEAYVLRPKASSVLNASNQPTVTRATQQAWLNGLGQWWKLTGNTPSIAPEYPFGKWRQVAGPQVTGSMLEHALRDLFVAQHRVPPPNNTVSPRSSTKGHLTRDKMPIAGGPDIEFLELAEFFYELDAALGRAA